MAIVDTGGRKARRGGREERSERVEIGKRPREGTPRKGNYCGGGQEQEPGGLLSGVGGSGEGMEGELIKRVFQLAL